MRPSALRVFGTLLRFELGEGFKGPLFWVALICLPLVLIPLRLAWSGQIVVMGQSLAESYRQAAGMALGATCVVFFSNLYGLCLCLERAGSSYLRHHDLMLLSRSVGRSWFFLGKVAGVWITASAYGLAATFLLFLDGLRISGIAPWSLLWVAFTTSLGLACIVSLSFCLRNFLPNFLIFFVWLLVLPVQYFSNLWHYYGVSQGSAVGPLSGFLLLPQVGGLHAFALGKLLPPWWVPGTAASLVNIALWITVSLVAGMAIFSRKRL